MLLFNIEIEIWKRLENHVSINIKHFFYKLQEQEEDVLMLKGIAASAGVSIAKAYKLESPKVEIVKKEGDPAIEVEKFNAALEKTKTDIEGV